MANNIGLLYVGNEAYVNDKFTVFPGQAIIVTDDLGSRLLNDFPNWFESFDEGVNEIIDLVGMNTPYNYLNQLEEFEDKDSLDEDAAQEMWDNDSDPNTDAPEDAVPMTDEEKALDAAVDELVDERVTDAVMAALQNKSEENEENENEEE